MTSNYGGKRVGAGRKPGSVTKKTREIADKAIGSGDTPLDYLLSVMRNTANEPAARLDAAKAAAPYMHPRLAPVEPQRTADDHVPLAERLKAYARRDQIAASNGRLIEFKKTNGPTNGHS